MDQSEGRVGLLGKGMLWCGPALVNAGCLNGIKARKGES